MISANVLVKNEENFIWYSVVSVINFVDEVLIWDTGSTDATKEIIKEITKRYPGKINYKDIGEVDENKYSEIRQQMLDQSKHDWIFILDGDEIYFESSIRQITTEIKQNGNKLDSIVLPTINLVGDMYHYQEENAGNYRLLGRKGHLALRFMNRKIIPGLHVFESYGKEGFADSHDTAIQNRNEDKILIIDAAYIHTTHLSRSRNDNAVMQRAKKLKHEIGIDFPKDFYYPESFFKERPHIVPNVWNNMQVGFKLRALIETPLRKLKRRIH